MSQNPIASYEGDIKWYASTKPPKGGKIIPNSAKVKKFRKFLEKEWGNTAELWVSPSRMWNVGHQNSSMTQYSERSLRSIFDFERVLDEAVILETSNSSNWDPPFLLHDGGRTVISSAFERRCLQRLFTPLSRYCLGCQSHTLSQEKNRRKRYAHVRHLDDLTSINSIALHQSTDSPGSVLSSGARW